MSVPDRYDGVRIGNFVTERYLEEIGAINSDSFGVLYNARLSNNKDAQDADVISYSDDDESQVFELVEPIREVSVQDSTTKIFFNNLAQAINSTPYVLASTPTVGGYTIVLTSVTGLSVNDVFGLFQDGSNPASYFGTIKSIVDDTLTMNMPIDIAYNTDSAVGYELLTNMNVDGSTPQIFTMTNQSQTPIDITRMILHITDQTIMDDAKFGGISALTNGVVLRKKYADGTYLNYFDIKNNGKIGELCYDKTYDDKAPSGYFGLTARLTFKKLGSVIRLSQGESLEILIQDDLTDLDTFTAMIEGHYTDEV